MLTNWMPFAQEELELGNVHVAALTGENGAGKSSILDAITWALWGKARGDSDEDRIRAGAQQCTVKLDFEVNGRRFKVVRTKKRGKGKASGQST
jgi:exonuclease SbcC